MTRRKPRGFAEGVQVRLATPSDAPAIAEIHVASWQVAYRGLFPDEALDRLSVAARLAEWTHLLSDASIAAWVCVPDRRVTGFVSICPSRDADAPSPQFVEIATLYIRPDAWGAGHGRALCQAVFEHLRRTPAQAVIVWALTGNIPARRFYEMLGFKPDDAQRDITMYGTTLPELRYRQTLR